MKFRIGETADYVEVGQYRAVDKGALQGFFTIVTYPSGQKMLDCRYFEQGDSRWFNFPQKEVKKMNSEKPEYIPVISYLNKEYLHHMKVAVLAALKELIPQEQNGKAQVQADPRQANPVRSGASSDWEECPF